jgi:hypothetical protein
MEETSEQDEMPNEVETLSEESEGDHEHGVQLQKPRTLTQIVASRGGPRGLAMLKHAQELGENSVTEGEKPRGKQAKQFTKLKCVECGKRYSLFASLKSHMTKVHKL